MDLKDLYTKADKVSGDFIKNIPNNQDYSQESILPGWSLRTLLQHLVSENYWMEDMLGGKTVAAVGDKYDRDLLGDVPKKAWEDSSKVSLEAVKNLDNLEEIIHLSYADVPASEYLSQRILDMTIHGWDVARSTNQDDTLPTDLLQYIWDRSSNREEEIRATGLFGNHIDVPEDADLETKVLALLGRKR